MSEKILFLAEQLSLVYCKPNTRRYSSSLLAMAFMWQSVSPKQISLDGILTLPSAKYVRNLVSTVGDDLNLTKPAEKYLTSRFSKLNQDDQKVSLLMDEVYCKQTVQYCNGQFYGKGSNEINHQNIALCNDKIGVWKIQGHCCYGSHNKYRC